MPVETIGQASDALWQVFATCNGCHVQERADLRTLLWTRGRDFPLDMLATRLRCPRCGCRDVRVMFSLPSQPKPASDLVGVPDRYWIEQLDLRGQVVDLMKRDRFNAAERLFESMTRRKPGARFVFRDGGRVIRTWPSRAT